MAPQSTTLAVQTSISDSKYQLDTAQTLRASTALLRKIQSDAGSKTASADKTNLLADADDHDAEDDVPLWLILTTKKHIVDKKRLKPGKIVLPHPLLKPDDATLRVCLVTADPQRKYKDLIESPGFPSDLAQRIRIIGITKLKARYGKSFEARRQLLSEYDVFLADDRVITYLPQVLGKTFYKSGSKRPIPVSLEGKRQDKDEQGNKRRKLSEGGEKVVKSEIRPQDVVRELQRALSCALVHLAPSTTTAVKVGTASMSAEDVRENVGAVVEAMVERYVPQKWQNLKAVHIKGPNTIALPIWLADELWADEQDVLEEAPQPKESKKRKRAALANNEAENVIVIPGPDGQMRKLERPTTKRVSLPETDTTITKKSTKKSTEDDAEAKITRKAEKAARREALKEQKEAAKALSRTTNTEPVRNPRVLAH